MSEFAVIGSLDPIKVGTQIDQTPLHVTVLRWTPVVNSELGSIVTTIESVAIRYPVVKLVGCEEAMFGPDNDIRVRKVATALLNVIHRDIIDNIGQTEIDMYSGSNYVPHVSYKEDRGLGAGEEFLLKGLHILSRTNKMEPRVVEAYCPLNDCYE